MKNILIVIGTRPEAIKMLPVYLELNHRSTEFSVSLCITGQHDQMIYDVLKLHQIAPDYDLEIMRHNGTLSQSTARIINKLDAILTEKNFDFVLVHGDTISTLSGAIVACLNKVKLVHVEAGLRSGDLNAPWPEELNRRIVSVGADIHFAPTKLARDNLISEQVDREKIVITGNTAIDAIRSSITRIQRSSVNNEVQEITSDEHKYKKLVLVTGHRRENYGGGVENICACLKTLAKNREIQIVFPVHLNPNIRNPVLKELDGHDNILLLPPLDYYSFVYLMSKCDLILTDSGGIQEEAPFLKKPVLLMRENTERPEAIQAGTVELVGTNVIKIVKRTQEILYDEQEQKKFRSAINPFGDGNAAIIIANHLASMRN